MSEAIRFEAQYPAELIDEVARGFVRGYLVRRYGVLVGSALLVDWIGVVLAFLFSNLVIGNWTLAAMIGSCTIYFAWFLISKPVQLATQLKAKLGPSLAFSLDEDSVAVCAPDQQISLEWTRFKAIAEFDAFFLLILSIRVFLVVPRNPLSARAVELVHKRVTHHFTRKGSTGETVPLARD